MMNNFLDKLKYKMQLCIQRTSIQTFVIDFERDDAINMIDSLGPNARRMLEIGILQDELVKLGFVVYTFNLYRMNQIVSVGFKEGAAVVYPWNKRLKKQDDFFRKDGIAFAYTSPTWQQDVLTKAKELINE